MPFAVGDVYADLGPNWFVTSIVLEPAVNRPGQKLGDVWKVAVALEERP